MNLAPISVEYAHGGGARRPIRVADKLDRARKASRVGAPFTNDIRGAVQELNSVLHAQRSGGRALSGHPSRAASFWLQGQAVSKYENGARTRMAIRAAGMRVNNSKQMLRPKMIKRGLEPPRRSLAATGPVSAAGEAHGYCRPNRGFVVKRGKRHLKALAGLFAQVLKLCEQAGLVKLGHVALDGTKIKANASKHKADPGDRLGSEAEKAPCTGSRRCARPLSRVRARRILPPVCDPAGQPARRSTAIAVLP